MHIARGNHDAGLIVRSDDQSSGVVNRFKYAADDLAVPADRHGCAQTSGRASPELQDFGNTLRAYGNLPQNAAKQREDQLNRINTAWGRLREETQRLDSDRDFQDDLMKE